MQTVYRMQNERGKGPYVAGSFFWRECAHDITTGRPNPSEEGKGFDESLSLLQGKHGWDNVLFGFDSLEAAHRWFSEKERAVLAEYGYKIESFKAEVLLLAPSQKQLVFKKGGGDYGK